MNAPQSFNDLPKIEQVSAEQSDSDLQAALAGTAGSRRWWMDMLLLAVLLPLAGVVLHPQDPLLLATGMPWLLMAGPILMGGKHGVAAGLVAGLIGIVLMAAESLLLAGVDVSGTGLASLAEDLNGSFAVNAAALLVLGLLCGEITAHWRRQYRRVVLAGHHQARRQETFLRHYHTLRVSHDQLAERMAATPFTLRDALTRLGRQFHARMLSEAVRDSRHTLELMGEEMLAFVAQYSRVRQMALVPVDANGALGAPSAWLGARGKLALDHPMLTDCVMHGEMTSLEDYTEVAEGMPLCVVPLVDLDGQVHGLFVVLDMPFVDFHEGQLQLLSVIGARLGEHMAITPRDESALHGSLARWQQHVRRNRVEAVAITLTLGYTVTDEQAHDISGAIDEQRRGLDECFDLSLKSGQRSWVTIMPLTGERAMTSYRARMSAALDRLFEDPAVARSLMFEAMPLDGKTSVTELMESLRRTPCVQSHSHAVSLEKPWQQPVSARRGQQAASAGTDASGKPDLKNSTLHKVATRQTASGEIVDEAVHVNS